MIRTRQGRVSAKWTPVVPRDKRMAFARRSCAKNKIGLLPGERERELAVAHARRKILGEFRDRILAIGADEFGQRRKQARLREAVAVDPLMPRFRPGLVEIAERGLLLLVVGQGIAGEGEGKRVHETNKRSYRDPVFGKRVGCV